MSESKYRVTLNDLKKLSGLFGGVFKSYYNKYVPLGSEEFEKSNFHKTTFSDLAYKLLYSPIDSITTSDIDDIGNENLYTDHLFTNHKSIADAVVANNSMLVEWLFVKILTYNFKPVTADGVEKLYSSVVRYLDNYGDSYSDLPSWNKFNEVYKVQLATHCVDAVDLSS